MNCLVTGATGFVGAHVVRKLLAAGHRVRILRRTQSRTKLLEGLAVEGVVGDVTDRASVLKAVAGCEAIFHVAGNVSFWRGNNEVQNAVNVGGTRNVVEACLTHRVKRLVHTSSVAALGFPPRGTVGDESLAYNGWPYRINYCNSKFLAEEEVREGIRKGLDAVIVNPAVIFGPGDLNFHGGSMVFQVAKGRIRVWFDGGCSTCDVEDVAAAHLSALEKGKTGERYILGGDNLTWRQLFTLIAEVVGAPIPTRKIPTLALKAYARWSDLRGRLTGRRPALTPEAVRISNFPVFFSSEKAVRELGYRISPLRPSLERTYRWYVENRYLQPPSNFAATVSR